MTLCTGPPTSGSAPARAGTASRMTLCTGPAGRVRLGTDSHLSLLAIDLVRVFRRPIVHQGTS